MEIKPIKSFRKTLTVAPDKSITHRAIMLNSLANGVATVKNALLGEDCLATIECMRLLGAKIEVNGDEIKIEGTNDFRSASLNTQNSGTTTRLLCGLLAGKKGTFTLDGDNSLRSRPMNRVISPLSLMGATIESNDGRAPLTVKGKDGLNGIEYEMPVASAQVKSAILLAGLSANGETVVREKIKSRNHTEIMLKKMGADIIENGNEVRIKRSKLKPVDIVVPGDISSASYFLVLGACCSDGEVTIKNVGVNETRTGILTVLEKCGAEFALSNETSDGEKVADITVKSGKKLKPLSIGEDIMPSLIDEIPIIAVLCSFIEGTSVISGASELKVKESNRIKTTVEMLKKMGVDAVETDDGMIIHGKKSALGGATLEVSGDHRIAMSSAVLGALSEKGVTLLGGESANVSYPGFYEALSNGEEKKYALLGHNISYSLSPLIHEEIFAQTGHKGSYELISASEEELPKTFERLSSEYDGFNITKPHKQAVIPYLEKRYSDSVNTVVIRDGKMTGYSTDAYGFLKDVERNFGKISGEALVLGAGGVAKVIAPALKELGLSVFVWNRTKARAEEFAKEFGAQAVNREDISPDFIVNCTSFGFNDGENPLANEEGKIVVDTSKVKWAYDTIYSPPETEFLKSFSCKKANGLGMLILQAIEADRIMCGLKISPSEEERIFNCVIERLKGERK